MKIAPPFKPPSNLYLSGVGDANKTWKVGELVRAIATKQHSPRELTLRIGREQYQAYARTPVPVGRPLLMRVIQSGEQPVLELVHAVNTGGRNGEAAALSGLLSNLLKLSERSGNGRLPHAVQAAALRLLSLLPEPGSLTGDRELRQLIFNSGSFLEAKLLQTVGSTTQQHFSEDWKVLLLRLQHALRSLLPGENRRAKNLGGNSSLLRKAVESFAEIDSSPSRSLLRQVDEALVRIELNQLSSRGSDDASKQIWAVEIPVRGAQGEPELLRMRIERDGGSSANKEDADWTLVLQMELGTLGSLTAKISMRREQVSVHFVAEETETARLLNRNLKQLEQNLSQRGLEVAVLAGRAGPRNAASAGQSGPLDLLA